jgi:hypothetical protein
VAGRDVFLYKAVTPGAEGPTTSLIHTQDLDTSRSASSEDEADLDVA